MYVLVLIPVLFPSINLFLIGELRSTTFAVVLCTFWKQRSDARRADTISNKSGDEVMAIVRAVLKLRIND